MTPVPEIRIHLFINIHHNLYLYNSCNVKTALENQGGRWCMRHAIHFHKSRNLIGLMVELFARLRSPDFSKEHLPKK